MSDFTLVVRPIDRPRAGPNDIFELLPSVVQMEGMPIQKVRLTMSARTPRRRARHHHRRYSWPPSLHLIDVSAIRIPLPDIDEDPFAHFVSPPEDDPEPSLDSIAFRAGIVATQHTSSKNDEKAYKFRTSIARKWARFIARYYAKLPHGHSESKDRKTNPDRDKPKKKLPSTPMSTTEASSSKKPKSTAKTETSKPTLGHAHALLAELDAQRRSARPSPSRQWHSFSEYSNTLPTIMEMMDEEDL